MANVRNKVNTRKNDSTSNGRGKVGRPKKSLVDVINKNDKPIQVTKDTVTSSSNEKVQNNTQLGQKLSRRRTIGELNKLPKDPKIEVRLLKKGNTLKNGHIKHKNIHDLKLYNNILKSELLIKESTDASSTNKLNNNNKYITDHNKDENTTISLFTSGELFKNDLSNKRERRSERHKIKTILKEKRKKKPLNKDLFFQCDHCQRKLYSKSSLRRHIYLHLDFKTYTCKQCKKTFRKQLYLSAHIKRQHPNWAEHYMCTMCDKPFLLRENLKNHLLSHARLESMFKCIYCKEQYLDQEDLINHEKGHLVDGKYQCIICEMSFDCRNRLTLHYKTHLRVKDYICQHCGKEFIRINSMRRHVQICHAGVRIQCPICKKYLKGHLTEHIRTHEKARPHICPDCGQRFTQSTQLNVHRRSHTGARPYPCRICGRPFSHSNALMLHIRRHTGEKPFVCAMCPLSFSQLPHMKAHMRNIHGKINPYKCQNCKQFFKLKVDLEGHKKVCTSKTKKGLAANDDDAIKLEEIEVESVMTLSRMRFLLALLLTMIATKEKLKYLGVCQRDIMLPQF
ncbi:zinc finger protein 37-like isoform X2 [Aricia agestis]|uniref:zinc finger protein 37-like isoform X2 n=1 Tax=Aricia agestis TaxID=91739 RepID=UPI001C2024BA|nr:zinc finger protein 37-like isoform X2 [Aricia agestis]